MSEKRTYQYSRGPIGVPSVLLATAWVAIWMLWPSLDADSEALGERRERATRVSYGVVRESLYMSPLLFARSTRVGFRPPEASRDDEVALDAARPGPRTRVLHVPPPQPDFESMRMDHVDAASEAKRVDGYRLVWKDETRFAVAESTNAVVVEVRGALKARAFDPAALDWPDGFVVQGPLQVDAFVNVSADGRAEDAFVERGSGDVSVDAAVVRALERGRAQPADGAVFGRVRFTIRSVE
ncbi:MAG: energy transducer TonB [Verrucomicrobia bacterium]|nr:energy transducer TonB [Verrucomicrobiota bacterium]MBT7068301.1 energy transducer TonB [Verrucomicrobiota bacterium]MBT7700627.1 energy transducer TonB [Verrucomicrobiota bacterium]